MVLFPAVNRLPETLSDAVAVAPDPMRLAVPSDVLPTVKETEPVGVALPLAAVTVAVRVVLPPAAMLVGLAVTVVVVETVGAVTVTVTDPEEAPKAVVPP